MPPRWLAGAARVLLLCLILWPGTPVAQVPPQCTHYAAPDGAGSACTQDAPCAVQTWTQSASLAGAGQTLCLVDGTYRRTQGGTIYTDAGLSGTQASPITVRALHDGQVLLDGESGFGVYLGEGSNYWHVWGINARNGKESLYKLKGSHNRLYRVIGWDGTTGQPDSGIFHFGFATGVDNVCVDCAGWGQNSRKIFSASQATSPGQNQQFSGCRRCWLEWNDFPQGTSQPTDTIQAGYRSREQRYENVLATWRQTGEVGEMEAIFNVFYDCAASNMSMSNTEVSGSLFYLRNGSGTAPPRLVQGSCTQDVVMRDVAAFVDTNYTNILPFFMINTASSPEVEGNNFCTNCLAVHAGTPSLNQSGAGWQFDDFHEGQGLAQATGGVSPFLLLPGLCYRIEGGVLTDQPLWSADGQWPMNARIKAARVASGAPEVDVTASVEAMLGPIPEVCRRAKPPRPPDPGAAAMACSGVIHEVPGRVDLVCVPQARR